MSAFIRLLVEKKSYLYNFLLLSILSMSNYSFSETVDMKNNIKNDTWHQSDVKPLETKFLIELKVNIGSTVKVGKSDSGTRQYIPITGGTFKGVNLKEEAFSGEVLAGGADWQLIRSDGVMEIDALYSIKADDGAVIVVHNKGIVSFPQKSDDTSAVPYVRSVPAFHAPSEKYDWLNKRIFTGTITPGQDGTFVTIRVFVVL